jgi:hypothetical protein
MNTRKNKTSIKNKTSRKNSVIRPSLNVLKVGYPLYASKQYEGSTILEYNKKEELKYNDKCLMQNSSWFGDLKVAKSYKTKNTNIYRWKIKKTTQLLRINVINTQFIDFIFNSSKKKLVPTIQLTKKQLEKIKYEHPYLQMKTNEKALYEFKFCFGFITVEEQYEFMKLIKYLIENKFIDIKMREGTSILNKIKLKIGYYEAASILGKKEIMNRLSFYDFDKHAIMNLCKLVNNRGYNISGVYQRNTTSFWFPDFIVYKMDIKEYILFDPQDNLVYDKLIE